MEYDLTLKSPCRTKVSYPNYNDCSMAQRWPIAADTVYVFDKGYYDFNWWWRLQQAQAYFVTRLKSNAAVVTVKQINAAKTGLTEDHICFKNKQPRGGKTNLYTANLRRILVPRPGQTPLVLVTNLMDVTAEEIARLYQDRWAIELFFKWLKQNLRIKKFLGKSENAVKIQLATALITYLLLQLYQLKTRMPHSLQLTLVWLSYNSSKSACQVNQQSPPHSPKFLKLPRTSPC